MLGSDTPTKKTDAEQSLLLNIQELQEELDHTTDSDRKEQLGEQISFLKNELGKLQGKDVNSLQKENYKLKKELDGLRKTVKELENKCNILSSGTESRDYDDGELKRKLYELLLRKYAKLINATEKKTVGEIKSLIDKSNLSVQSFLEKYKSEDYSFDKDYLNIVKKIYDYFVKEFTFIRSDLNINFWLTPEELFKYKIGDDEDLAVLLCTMLFALGDKRAEVVISEMEDLSTHAFVLSECAGKFMILDPCQNIDFETYVGNKIDVLSRYNFKGNKIKKFLYKFNNDHYEQFIT